MTRVKVCAIDSCRDCPYHVGGWGSPMRCGRVIVSGSGDAGTDPAGRAIPYAGCVIPPWCPLPDAPKAESSLIVEGGDLHV